MFYKAKVTVCFEICTENMTHVDFLNFKRGCI